MGKTFEDIGDSFSVSSGGNFFEDLLNNVANIGLQAGTGGLVGFKNGGFQSGATTKVVGGATVDGLKEVTGANAAEAANEQARAQFEQTKADADAARVAAQNQTANDQLLQSQTAGAARNATSRRSSNKSSVTSALGNQQDFLGL